MCENNTANITKLYNNAKNIAYKCLRTNKTKNLINYGDVSSANSTKSQLLNIGDAENARLQNVATLQKHTNKNFNKKEKYAQTTLTRLAGDKCIAKGAMYINLKNKVTNKVNNKALSTYKETVQHKHATLTMLMWLLVICLSLTMLVMLPTTNYKANTMAIGTAENPDLTIDSVEDLLALSTQTGEFAGSWGTSSADAKYIKLTTDLVVTANDLTQNDEGTYNWDPIGNDSNPFYGTFDGDNHTITFEPLTTANQRFVGLFGSISNSSIINLGVKWIAGLRGNSTLWDDFEGHGTFAEVGGIVGYGINSNIE